MNTYNRILEEYIKPYLFEGKAIVLIGARQVGKTTLLRSLSSNFENMLWLNADLINVRALLTDPDIEALKKLIGSYKVVIIDEIQRIQNAGLLLKIMVDNFPEVQFMATGSSSLEISDKIFEPMTGRIFLFHLYPFCFKELYSDKSKFEIEEKLSFHLIYGNYPEVVTKPSFSENILSILTEQYLYKDVLIWKDIRKPDLLDRLLKLLAYQIGSEVSIHELSNQLKVKSETIETYIELLEKSFVIYRLSSHNTNLRKEVNKMNKIMFWDNGIRNAIIDDFRDISIRNDQGQLFENFLISERIKTNSMTQNFTKYYFWRNYNQREVDYVELQKGTLKAYEIKWNVNKGNYITKAFTNLYPNALTQVLTPNKFVEFVLGE